MGIQMDGGKARLVREIRLWAESMERELQPEDDALAFWMKQRNADRVPANEMLEHYSAAELLDAVVQRCREYACGGTSMVSLSSRAIPPRAGSPRSRPSGGRPCCSASPTNPRAG